MGSQITQAFNGPFVRIFLAFFASVAVWAQAQDWSGPFRLVPVSAPEMALEAVLLGTAENNAVSLNTPTGASNQVWVITRKENAYSLCPASAPTLALTVPGGGTNNGTPVILASDVGKLWQRWTIKANVNGSFSLLSAHAPTKGLDDFGGGRKPGARQDLWDYHVGDEHLEWMLKPLAGASLPAEFALRSSLDPISLPKGVIKEFTFTESRIYPGTRRTGSVFIPAQLDPEKPACVYVRQDGYNRAEKGLLEVLIARGDMPVTVGVFVRPGELPAPMSGTLGRRNRCFEYDAVNDSYARFLVEELLPFVAREFGLCLSTNGNDRCIAGGSSGGISAFTAAWLRPDAFSRVYANSGSFVAFRGGHEFPTLVRKTEPKPIRAYLTTGTHDMENCAGDWYLLDQEMDKALKFSGYDYFFRAIEGPHVAGWLDCFPEAMRFIWKGWPEPVKAGEGAPRLRDVLVPNEGWTLAAEGFADTRGAACNATGEVFFVDSVADKIYRIGRDGKVSAFLEKSGRANAVTIGPRGEVYTVSEATGRIEVIDAAGARTVIAEGVPGRHLLARADGSLYVAGSRIWLVRDGKATVVDEGLKHATGLACRPDRWLLTVADGASKWANSYQIKDDGTLVNKERFFWLHVQDWDDDAGAESVCFAQEGKMLVATRSGIQICADDGPTQVILPMPDRSRVFSVCLGGPELNTLFALCGTKVWKRTVKLHASGAFTPWTAVRTTPL